MQIVAPCRRVVESSSRVHAARSRQPFPPLPSSPMVSTFAIEIDWVAAIFRGTSLPLASAFHREAR